MSAASNIVEGCARESFTEYIRFLDIAYASACELQYQISLAARLEYLTAEHANELSAMAIDTSKVLNALLRALRTQPDG